MHSTFIATDVPSTAVAGLDVESLARAGNQEPQTRKPTVTRRPNPAVRGYGRSMAFSSIAEDDSRPYSSSVTHRKAEISAEPMAGNTNSAPYRKEVFPKSEAARVLIRKAVDSCLLFTGLSEAGKNEVVDAFQKVEGEMSPGQVLIEEGEWGDAFYILETGTCEAIKHGVGRVMVYESGGSFGELALMYGEPRAATVRITSSTALLYSLDRHAFKSISVHFKVAKQKQYEEELRKVPSIDNTCTSDEMNRLVECVEEKVFGPQTKLCQKGEMCNELMIILEGKVQFSSESETTGAQVGDMFGEKALEVSSPYTFTLQTKEQKCVVLVLTRAKLEEVYGCPLTSREQIASKPNRLTRPVSMASIRQTGQHRYHINILFEDLDTQLGAGQSPRALERVMSQKGLDRVQSQKGMMGERTASSRMFRSDTVESSHVSSKEKHEIVLGVGTFGKVLIVRSKLSGDAFAMKRLNKSWIVENCLEQHVVDERNVMTLIDHPFIIKLHNSFFDERYVYLLLELCLGGELFFYLRKLNKFTEQQARFYIASITLAFEHLHSKNIIYRDLKPENLMLSETGFLKIVDFGLAKVVKGRTWTICGTPEYLAPEVVLSKGHNRGVDWWGLGILIFELTAGYCPFVGDDNMVVYRLIVDNRIEFPPHTTPQLREICKDFTRSSQLVRLGLRRPGSRAIKENPWFEGFDWKALEEMTMAPAIQTKVRNKVDVSNFEEYTGSEQDFYEALPCDWEPSFPYQVVNGKTII